MLSISIYLKGAPAHALTPNSIEYKVIYSKNHLLCDAMASALTAFAKGNDTKEGVTLIDPLRDKPFIFSEFGIAEPPALSGSAQGGIANSGPNQTFYKVNIFDDGIERLIYQNDQPFRLDQPEFDTILWVVKLGSEFKTIYNLNNYPVPAPDIIETQIDLLGENTNILPNGHIVRYYNPTSHRKMEYYFTELYPSSDRINKNSDFIMKKNAHKYLGLYKIAQPVFLFNQKIYILSYNSLNNDVCGDNYIPTLNQLKPILVYNINKYKKIIDNCYIN